METLPDLRIQRPHRAAGLERKRAAQACDSCRRQKEKCEGGQPCRRCARLGHKCDFSSRAPRRRPGAFASAVPATSRPASSRPRESLARPLPRSASQDDRQGASRLSYLEKIVQQYTGVASLDSETLRALAENPAHQGQLASSASPAAVPSSSSDGLDHAGVDGEGFCIKPLANNVTHYSGEFSHWNFSMRIKEWIDRIAPPDNGPQDKSTPIIEYYRPEELQSPSNADALVSFLPPRFVTNFLVHAFFAHAEANYWYLERGWLNEKLDAIYDDPGALCRRDAGTICIISMVLAIGTQYAYLDKNMEHQGEAPAATRRPRLKDGRGNFTEDSVGITLYQQACRLVPDVITISSLESVQACLLIGVYTLPLDASGLSYIYLNLALKLAIQNGMHRTYSGEGLDSSLWETRNRVWWTVYTLERRVAVFHGRPLSIPPEDVDLSLPVDRQDMWPSTTSTHTAQVLATMRLNQFLCDISHEISLLKTYTTNNNRQEPSSDLDRLIDLHHELATWWNSLPTTICARGEPSSSSSQSEVSRSSVHLRLEYCLLRIFVGRAFIFPSREHARRQSNRSPSGATTVSASAAASGVKSPLGGGPAAPPLPSSSRGHGRSILVADCIEASLEVIDTCRLLRDSIGLARASYTEFSACRAALLVITTQCLQDGSSSGGDGGGPDGVADRFRGVLRQGLAMLKEMSAGSDSAQSETSLIDAFERAIAKFDAVAAAASAGKATAADSEYSRFKKWEQLWNTNTSLETTHDKQAPNMDYLPPAGLRSTLDAPLPRQGWMVSLPTNTPFFGIDGNFSSFPQMLDEVPSFSTHHHHSTVSPSNRHGIMSENTWMGD